MLKFEKIVFAHDGTVSINNRFFRSHVYNMDIINRYLKFSKNVSFLVRKGSPEMDNNLIEIPENIEFKTVDDFKSFSGYKNISKVLEKIYLEIQDADLVICRLPSDLGILSFYAAKKSKKNILIEVVGCPWDSYRTHSKSGYILAPIYYFIQKKIVKDSDNVIYVTNEFLQKRYPNKSSSIGCSDVILPNKTKFVNRYKDNKIENIVMGTVGNIEMKYKGFEAVFKAICILNKKGFKVRYEIVGPGDPTYLNKLIKKYDIEKQVSILGSKGKDELFEWLDSNINIYIQPSYTEGLPRALIEAMSRSLVCFGSNVGGIPELLPPEQLFPPKKSKSIAKLIEKTRELKLSESALKTFKTSQVFHLDIIESEREKLFAHLRSLNL